MPAVQWAPLIAFGAHAPASPRSGSPGCTVEPLPQPGRGPGRAPRSNEAAIAGLWEKYDQEPDGPAGTKRLRPLKSKAPISIGMDPCPFHQECQAINTTAIPIAPSGARCVQSRDRVAWDDVASRAGRGRAHCHLQRKACRHRTLPAIASQALAFQATSTSTGRAASATPRDPMAVRKKVSLDISPGSAPECLQGLAVGQKPRRTRRWQPRDIA